MMIRMTMRRMRREEEEEEEEGVCGVTEDIDKDEDV